MPRPEVNLDTEAQLIGLDPKPKEEIFVGPTYVVDDRRIGGAIRFTMSSQFPETLTDSVHVRLSGMSDSSGCSRCWRFGLAVRSEHLFRLLD